MKLRFLLIVSACCLATEGRAGAQPPLDHALRARLVNSGITRLDTGPKPWPAKVRLGQLLFLGR